MTVSHGVTMVSATIGHGDSAKNTIYWAEHSSFKPPDASFSHLRTSTLKKIRANGVGELSAGKSSVLEGITGIPFPRQEGLYIRFPTEIILRYSKTSEITTIRSSIRPYASRTLKDITGPISLHLSIVDLPGLILVISEEQIEEDIDAVYNMVATYLQNSRTIILTVLQARIITKPDLVNKGAEAKIALVARNYNTIKLKLGFFLLKNPSPLLDTHIERELPKVRDEIKKCLAAMETELNLSMRFFELIQAALNGNYYSTNSEFFSGNKESRLQARVQEKNTDFATDIRINRERRKIEATSQSSSSNHESTDETAQLIVKQAYSCIRGKELPGNFNSALLSELFHEQIIHEEGLHSKLNNTEKLALEKLDRLVQDDRGSPLTYNHYYTNNIQNAIALLHISNNTDNINRFVAVIELQIVVDIDEQAHTEALTELSVYYKVVMKIFVDNVARQVIERHILSPLSKAFYPNSVSQLSDEALLRIGLEPEQQSAKRTRLTTVAEGLRRSLVDLQRPL
ncbi:P-loop containing nucleoside triphosphate hydrolase protein [Ilyonectria sp. MPI-CAGE-AT-0026]|nr:P-loop containing nucleoside triphosphate hydrolase protein [Ilyonectria sp. MPI-CAGE-AT-0026]